MCRGGAEEAYEKLLFVMAAALEVRGKSRRTEMINKGNKGHREAVNMYKSISQEGRGRVLRIETKPNRKKLQDISEFNMNKTEETRRNGKSLKTNKSRHCQTSTLGSERRNLQIHNY